MPLRSKYFTLLTLFLLLAASCKKDKKKEVKEEISQEEVQPKVVKPEGLAGHFTLDSLDAPSDYIGKFVADRDNAEGNALELDGRTGYVLIAEAPELNPENEITISLWYKPTISFKGTGNNAIVSKGFSTYENPYFQYHVGVVGDQSSSKSPASFTFGLTAGDKLRIITTEKNTWEIGRWYHLVATYDGKKMRLYVNKELKGVIAGKGAINNYGEDLFIGRFSNREAFTPGAVDDVKIFNRALSAEEIESL